MILEGSISVKAAMLGNHRKVERILMDEARHDKEASFLLAKAREKNIPVERRKREALDEAASGRTHGGILAEAVYREKHSGGRELGIIVGIGINISTTDFPEDVLPIAGALGAFSEEAMEKLKEEILSEVGEELLYFFEHPKDRGFRDKILSEYREMSMVIGKQVSFYKDGEAEEKGIAKEILDDGSLVVENREGALIVLNSGEIHLHMD